ncbi:ImmA/IrrE family metallo-endopeptidase [Halorubrum halodurans]|uniref:DUF955 domain-containing protein n=1 Tax=Halorubrum halodurans TaxID=1383851 RepID=A0A256IJE1_9EURY|nr:hypothetical protein [Halorubrum halodurans]OYR56671.1 hypothetical protein DJ70_08115 [Halorubrum halodurans]
MATAQTTLSDTQHTTTNNDTADPIEINDADDIHNAVDEFTGELLDAVDNAAATGQITEYLNTLATVGASRYSIRNQIALMQQLRARDEDWTDHAEHWAGFWTWQNEHGRAVQKGADGFTILAPVTGPACPDCGNAPNYHANRPDLDCPRAGEDPGDWDFDPSEEWSDGVYYFSTATTFAYPQTEPLEDADPDDVFEPQHRSTGNDDRAADLFDALRDAAETAAFDGTGAIRVTETGRGRPGVRGSSSGGRVDVAGGDRSAADTFRTLAHEIAHELLHFDGPVPSRDVPDEVKELEAEAVAYTVARSFGFQVDGSELYVGAWLQHAKTTGVVDPDDEDDIAARDVIRDRLDEIRSVAAEIIEEIDARRD